MKYKVLTLLCLIIFSLSACGTKVSNKATTVQITVTPTIMPTSTPAPTSTPTPIPTSIPTAIPEPAKEHSKAYSMLEESVGEEFISEDGKTWEVEITDGITTYSRNTVVLFDDSELTCVVERFRTVDPLSDRRYVIIDFSIWNLSDSDFISSESYLSLSDSNGYSYNPTIYFFSGAIDPVGDLNMTLKPGDMARGEVTFEVPYRTPSDLVLKCDIPSDEIGRALFPIDLSECVNQNGTQSSLVK